MDGGIPDVERRGVGRSATTTSTASARCSTPHPGQIAAVFLEPARIEEPPPGSSGGLRDCAREHGAVLVFDEMITGFR